jgi:hypothetical protein
VTQGSRLCAFRNVVLDCGAIRDRVPPSDQTESRSAFAAACRRSLTSASSRAARSMRSCCICARFCWLSTRSCWLSARACWRSARSVIACRSFAIASTVRVSSASCSATLAMSSSVVTFRPSVLGRFFCCALPTTTGDRGPMSAGIPGQKAGASGVRSTRRQAGSRVPPRDTTDARSQRETK